MYLENVACQSMPLFTEADRVVTTSSNNILVRYLQLSRFGVHHFMAVDIRTKNKKIFCLRINYETAKTALLLNHTVSECVIVNSLPLFSPFLLNYKWSCVSFLCDTSFWYLCDARCPSFLGLWCKMTINFGYVTDEFLVFDRQLFWYLTNSYWSMIMAHCQ